MSSFVNRAIDLQSYRYVVAALILFCVCVSTACDAVRQRNHAELVQDCYNSAYNTTPGTFGSFLANLPVSFNISKVWSSPKDAWLPLTVFTTATMDRLHHLEALCQTLPGSISGAVYVPLVRPRTTYMRKHNNATLQAAHKTLQDMFDRLTAQPTACRITLFLAIETVADRAVAALVPINALRNLALLGAAADSATTTTTTTGSRTGGRRLMAMIDVDLAVSRSLVTAVLANQSRVHEMQDAGSVMWVLPAWQTPSHVAERDAKNTVLSALQGDKARLSLLWSSRHLQMFSAEVYPGGHNATNYRRWFEATATYAVRYTHGYEPWGITVRERHTSMPYDIRFRGCFRDKVTHVASLAHAGITFMVLHDAWLVHQPHNLSAAAAVAFGRVTPDSVVRVQPLQQLVSYRGIETTKFMLHKAHSVVTGDQALAEMAKGTYRPATGPQYDNCRAKLPWMAGV